MRTIRTAITRACFLNALAENGNVREVCRSLDLTRNAVYQWRKDDSGFAAAWESALQLGAASLEDEANHRAMTGSDYLLVFLLRSLKPEKYRDRSTLEINTRHKADYRDVPADELHRRLDQLRLEQDTSLTVGTSGEV